MNDQRIEPRKRPSATVSVSDAIGGQRLGLLGNLSRHGLMLIAAQPFEEEQLCQVMLAMPVADSVPRELELGVQCLWCEEAATAGTWWAGFRIVDISEADGAWLEQTLAP